MSFKEIMDEKPFFKAKPHLHSSLGVLVANSPLISDRLKKSFEVGNYEVNEATAMISLLNGGERVLELGGGVGVVSSAIGKATSLAAHHIVEADRRLIPVMEETHRLNGVKNIEIHNCVVTSNKAQIKSGKINFALAPNYTANSVKTVGIGRQEVEVPVKSLSQMVEYAKPNVLICDIEGAEVDLLSGADLSMFNLALVELHPQIIGSEGISAVFEAMHSNGLVYAPENSHGIFVVFKRVRRAMAPVVRDVDHLCNVCGGNSFLDFRNRKNARCADCQTLERGRLLQIIIDKLLLVKPGQKVLHLAPEVGIARNIKKIVGDGYEAIDINPDLFPIDLNVRKFDLTVDVETLKSDYYDIVLHSHVMEHIACDMTSVLWHLHRALNATGRHVFCVPVIEGNYAADFSPLTAEEKTKRFGQFDHCRKFGSADFDMHLGKVFVLSPFDAATVLNPQLCERHCIPMTVANGINSSTYFIQSKESLRLK